MCSCGTWCVCSSQISSAVPHANTEPMLGSTLPCKSLGEAWEVGTMWSGILEVSKENMGGGGKDENSHGMDSHHVGKGKCVYFRTT